MSNDQIQYGSNLTLLHCACNHKGWEEVDDLYQVKISADSLKTLSDLKLSLVSVMKPNTVGKINIEPMAIEGLDGRTENWNVISINVKDVDEEKLKKAAMSALGYSKSGHRIP